MNDSGRVAFIEIRVFPWRPQARVMNPEDLRYGVAHSGVGGYDLEGFVVGLVFMLFVVVAAPFIVLVLAGIVFAFELPLLIALALGLVIARLVGVLPWTIAIISTKTGTGQRERTRNLIRAIRRVREVNGTRRVPVRWNWS